MRTTRHPAATRHRSVPSTSTLADAIGQALHAPRNKRRASAAMALVALALAAPVAQAQSTDWIGAPGVSLVWENNSNWSNNAPNGNSANITNGGNARITSIGQTDDLTVGGGSWVWVSTAAAQLLSNRAFIDDGGAVDVLGTWNAGELNVGIDGMGRVGLTNGAALNSDDAIFGVNAGGIGWASVATGSSWNVANTLTIGRAGEGHLLIASGGTVTTGGQTTIGDLAGSEGYVAVDGAGSSLNSGPELFIGHFGSGTLAITNGATVVGNTVPDPVEGTLGNVRIGDEAGSTGRVTVDGAGSSFTSTGDLFIGRLGNGSLEITNGAAAYAVQSVVGYRTGGVGSVVVDGAGSSFNTEGVLLLGSEDDTTGSVTIRNGGALNSGFANLGLGPTSMATVLVDGAGSIWNNAGGIGVAIGGTATLTIRNGATVSSGFDAISTGAGSKGDVVVENAGSRWDNDGLIVGGAGVGSLTIRDGGVVNSGTGSVGVAGSSSGVQTLGDGTVVVEGAGSSWTITGALDVGTAHGTVTIRDGASLASGDAVVGNFYSSRYDNISGDDASVLIDGPGSTWTSTGTIAAGLDGNGLITVQNGGTITSDGGAIGLNARSTEASILVDGAGSSWTMANLLTVGVAGSGALDVQNGGTLGSGSALIGSATDSAGSVIVDGVGSNWGNTSRITVGSDGSGLLSIQNGAVVASDQVVVAANGGSDGAVVIDGAGSKLSTVTGFTVGLDGDGSLNVRNGGTMQSGDASIGSGFGTGSVSVSGPGSRWAANAIFVGQAGNGTLTIDNGGTVDGQSGFVAQQAGTQSSVLIDGIGSRWTNSDFVTVGMGGEGTLTVADGAIFGASFVRLGQFAGSTGILNVGNGGIAGQLDTASVLGMDGTAIVNFNHSDDLSTTTAFLGSLAFNKLGTGTLLLAGTSDYTGATQVQSGALMVEGSLGNTTTTVFNGAALGGTGTIAGDVFVNDGATLSPGMGPGTLTVGSLSLSSGSILDYELGQAGVIGSGINDLIQINGNLTLDGTMNITDAGGFGAGVYRLMNYGGSFVDHGLDLGVLPTGFTSNDLFVQTAIAGQVNLINTAGVSLNFWDGAAGPTDDGFIQGGDGVWVSNDRSWTNPDGSLNGNWNQGFAVFGGAAGTVTVMGEQAFTGMQFMTDGYRLQAGTDGALRASGTTNLRVDPNVTATIATPIVGDATLVKVDEGTLVFEGDFGYTGGLVVNGGLLIGDTGNLLGNILNRAQLEFAQADDGTYAGTMTGDGSLTKSGVGTLTLTGNADHSGGTTIEAGTLQVGDGGTSGSLAGDVEIQTDGTLAFNRSDNLGFAGMFSGDGALEKFGAGTLWLTGDSSAYAGQGTLHAGGLQVDGTLGGFLDVLAGATLSGSGTLGSVDNAGTISPNGTLTFTGDYVHRDAATYNVDIAPDGTGDLLDIAGTATIEGGQVYVIKAPGQYAGGTRYTIVDADGGVIGTFDALDQNLPFLDMLLGYDANHVYLDIVRNDTAFGSLCGTGSFNQCEVAKTLDSFDPNTPPTADLGKMVEQVTTLDEKGALAAFDRLSGEAHPSLAGIVLEGHALYGQTVTRRMAERREAVGADRLHGGTWVRAYGASSELDGDGNAHGADWNLHGLAVGFDTWGSENWLIGASVNAMRLDADFRPGDSGQVDAKNVALYTSFQGERAYLDAVASYAWWDNDVTRSIQVGNIDRTAKSEYGSHRFATYLEGGWTFNLGEHQLLQPMLTVQYDRLASEAFQEHGAQDLDLIGRSDSVSRLTTGAGARWSTTIKRGEWTLEPTVQARWLHSAGDDYAEFDVAFAGAPDQSYRAPEFGWRVRGVTLPQDRGVFGLGLAARNDNLDLFVDYDYQNGDGYQAHNLSAGLRYRW